MPGRPSPRHPALRHGVRVETPGGPGRVEYIRMSPPEYTQLAAVCVILDQRRLERDYRGTIYLPELVREIDG
jgi:hypothetical protein